MTNSKETNDDSLEDGLGIVAEYEPSKSRTGHSSQSRSDEEELAKKETAAVLKLRVLVFVALLFAALAVSMSVFFVTSRGEAATFESDFEGSAKKMLQAFQEIVDQKVLGLSSFSAEVTSYERSSDTVEWPFVTVPDFHVRAQTVLALTKCLFIALYPLVSDDTVREWGPYSLNHIGWLEEGRQIQREAGFELLDIEDEALEAAKPNTRRNRLLALAKDTHQDLYQESDQKDKKQRNLEDIQVDFSSGIGSEVYTFDAQGNIIADPGPGPYTPIWMTSPALPAGAVNLNVKHFPQFGEGIKACIESSSVVFGGFDLAPPGGIDSEDLTTAYFAAILSYEQKKVVEYTGDPFSSLYVPIFDSYSAATRQQTGLFVVSIKWSAFFENLLTSNENAISVVLENTCDTVSTATYLVDGPDVQFVGLGDHHDTKYSNMGESASFLDLIQNKGSGNGIEINLDQCSYTIRIYPTKAFEDGSTTNLPIAITCAIAFIFIFTAVMFIIYDRLGTFFELEGVYI